MPHEKGNTFSIFISGEFHLHLQAERIQIPHTCVIKIQIKLLSICATPCAAEMATPTGTRYYMYSILAK